MARKIAVEIVGDASSLQRALKKSSKSTQQFNNDISKTGKAKRTFGGLGKAASLAGGLIGVGGLASAAKAAFTEMGDAQKVSAQTAAALKSTKGAANVTAGEIDKLSESLMKMSGTDDEAIKSGSNLLLTFTNIRNGVGKGNDIFNQATGTMLDMSTALGQDTKSSAIQLGKALNDPVKGITALSRVGVSFTKDQKKQIEAMVASGDTMGAQKVILKELNKEFGGSAKAVGQTLPGKLNKLKETFLNLGGTLAESLTPEITAAVTAITDWVSKSENQKAIIDTVKGVVEGLKSAVSLLKTAFNFLSKAVGGNENAIKFLIAMYAGFKILTIAGKVNTLATSFGGAKGKANNLKNATKKLNTSLIGKAGLAGAAGLAAYGLTTMFLNATGLDQKLRDIGGAAYDLAAKLGLVNDEMAQFEGKKMPTQGRALGLRRQAARLQAKGLTTQQSADRLARSHPNIAKRDIEVYAGVHGGRTALQVQGGIHLHGVTNIRQLEDQMAKRSRQRPHRRRGT